MTSVSMGTSRYCIYSSPSTVTTATISSLSMVLEFIFPPSIRGSTKVPSPILLNFPGSRSAMLWNMLAICPCGRLYASKRFSEIISMKGGQRPQCPPMTFVTSPSWARWAIPSFLSDCPQVWNNVRPRGVPVSRNFCSIAFSTVSLADTNVIPMVHNVE